MPDNEVVITVTANDQASKTLKAVGQAFNMISSEVKDVTSKYIEYGAQVQKIALFTGVSNENTSRLIQLADDAFVSADTLQLAMKNMAQKGLQPSAENMAKLSNEFLKIQDPAKRSEFLIKEFGRSAMEMSKIMDLGGTKILQMNKDIEAGLIIDDQKQAKIQATKQALDKFNDSMDAMKYDVAAQLLDIFSAMPQPIQTATLALNSFLSPTNINSMIQFGILLKGANFATLFTGIGAAVEGAYVSLGVFAIDAWAALAPILASVLPILALVAALTALGYIIYTNKDAIGRGIQGYQNDAASLINSILSGGKRASGGPVRAGSSYLVGEGGPELFSPGESGSIIPNSGIGGGTVVLQLQYSPVVSMGNRYEAETILLPYIQSALRKING
jgi:hypothetical protein